MTTANRLSNYALPMLPVAPIIPISIPTASIVSRCCSRLFSAPSIQDYGGTATVDRKRLTADVARRLRREEHDRPLDIVVAASAAQRRDLRDLIGPFRQPGRQLRREITRTDGVDVDVVLAPLGRERLGERDQRALARIVGDREDPAVGAGTAEPRDRRDVDDLAGVIGDH